MAKSNNLNLEIVCDTIPPSKKNNQQILINQRTGKRFISSSKDHKLWENNFLWDLKKYKPKTPIKKCFEIRIDFYFDSKRIQDLTNKTESLMDALVKGGIIQDDNWICTGTMILIPHLSSPGESGCKISITYQQPELEIQED